MFKKNIDICLVFIMFCLVYFDIKSMQQEKIDPEECAICLLPIQPEQDEVCTGLINIDGQQFQVSCTHAKAFHNGCIKKWVKDKKLFANCPLCRKDITTNNNYQEGIDNVPEVGNWKWLCWACESIIASSFVYYLGLHWKVS